MPVSGSNLPGACHVTGSASAKAYPLPLTVMQCSSRGPFMSRSLFSVPITSVRLFPLTGPKYLNPRASKRSPPDFLTNHDLRLLTQRWMKSRNAPTPRRSQILLLKLLYERLVERFRRCSCIAPRLLSIDWLLSLRMTRRSALLVPALFRPSKASPPVIAPSPIRATTFSLRPCSLAASASPRAADIEVEECPTPNASYSLSLLLGKPLMPPWVRRAPNFSLRPVRILWA